MATQAISPDVLPSYNPATGEVSENICKTDAKEIAGIVTDAHRAQEKWAATSIAERCALLAKLKETILSSRNELADTIVRESGKPRVEALFADIFVALDSAEYWSRKAPAALRRERVPHHSLAAKAKSGYLVYEPLGVIGIIS